VLLYLCSDATAVLQKNVNYNNTPALIIEMEY